jgi:hypothetical protein
MFLQQKMEGFEITSVLFLVIQVQLPWGNNETS